MFGYNLNEQNEPIEEEIQEIPNNCELASPEPERNYCIFCGWKMSIEKDLEEEK